MDLSSVPTGGDLLTLASKVAGDVQQRHSMLVTVEAWTGAWIAKTLTHLPGSSTWFDAVWLGAPVLFLLNTACCTSLLTWSSCRYLGRLPDAVRVCCQEFAFWRASRRTDGGQTETLSSDLR